MANKKKEAQLIVSNFIYNGYLASVVDGGHSTVTDKDITNFINARQVLSIEEYRTISALETERFKKNYDL